MATRTMRTTLELVSGKYTTGRMTLEIIFPDEPIIGWAQFALDGQAFTNPDAMGCISDFQFEPDGEERSTLASIKEAAMDWAGRALVPDELRADLLTEWTEPTEVTQ